MEREKEIGKRNCVKCGRNLKDNQKLRCESCIRYVDAELRGEINMDYKYYFKFYIKKAKRDERILGKRVKDILKV